MGAIIGFVLTVLVTVLWRTRAAPEVVPVPIEAAAPAEAAPGDLQPQQRTPADVKKRVDGTLHAVPFDQMRAK